MATLSDLDEEELPEKETKASKRSQKSSEQNTQNIKNVQNLGPNAVTLQANPLPYGVSIIDRYRFMPQLLHF